MKVLLVEDDVLLGDGLRAGALQAGDAVEWVRDGPGALEAMTRTVFDIVVLDLGLPGMSGLELLGRLRKQGNTIPVLILTARDGVDDRVRGLDRGADDYVTKPFDLQELRARMRALVRRGRGQGAGVFVAGAVVLDPAAHVVTLEDAPVKLSPSEFSVLRELMENVGRVLSRERLERCLHRGQDQASSNTVEVHVHHLRRKLGDDVIKTVRGVGYMIARGA